MNSIFYKDMMEYLPLREKNLVPHTFAADRRALLSFDRHLAERGKSERCITEDDVISWIQPMYSSCSRSGVSHRVGALRMFLQYLRHEEIPVYIPPRPRVPGTYMPHLFSDEELAKLFCAADNFTPKTSKDDPRLRMEFPMLLRMLYSCGFRLGELLAVQVRDVDFVRGVIFLRDTKNKKQRIVPLGNTLSEMLNCYCLAMELLNDPDNYLFPAKNRRQSLPQSTARYWFRELLKITDIYVEAEAHTRRQCLHCFRHLFAVKSFSQTEQAGRSIQDSIPFLSVYLGHGSMEETERYLKFSNDMFPEHTSLFETYAEGIFPEVCYEE